MRAPVESASRLFCGVRLPRHGCSGLAVAKNRRADAPRVQATFNERAMWTNPAQAPAPRHWND
jgi:hypothetical protein